MVVARSLKSVAAALVTIACLDTPMSMAVNQQASFFDMPAKTPEQMKSIVNDIPALRALKHKKQTGTSARPSIPKTAEEKEQDRKDKSIRTAERRARAKELIAQHQPEPGVLERMDESAVRRLRTNAVESDPNLEQENNSWLRDLSSSSATSSPYWKADTGEYYDKFAQGYRMLGGFIDCDHAEDGSGDHSGDNKNGNNNNNGNSCSRWMMWAAVSYLYLYLCSFHLVQVQMQMQMQMQMQN